MLTPKDLEKYHQAAERILNAMDNSPVPISWHEMDRMASIVCWAIPDLFDRIGCDVLIFFHGIEQVFANWQTPTIFSASDCQGIINNFLPTIHEVY